MKMNVSSARSTFESRVAEISFGRRLQQKEDEIQYKTCPPCM